MPCPLVPVRMCTLHGDAEEQRCEDKDLCLWRAGTLLPCFQGMFLELRSCYPEDYSALSCLSGSLQTDCRGWEEVCE